MRWLRTDCLLPQTGHGEKSADDNYTQFKKNLQNYNYAAKSLFKRSRM